MKIYRVDPSDLPPEALGLRGYTQSPDGRDPSLHTEENLASYPVGGGAPQWTLLQKAPVSDKLGVALPGQTVKP